jgi:glycosyltransferase involved in cell wall biosynthesis
MQKKISDCSIALVYDHLLTKHGGAELVLESLLTVFPQAQLFTTIQDTELTTWHAKTTVHRSGLQRFLFLFRKRELLDAVTPITIEQFDFSSFDIVISITSSAAKGVITGPQQLHICYLLTPTRYLYHDAENLLAEHAILSLPIINWFARKFLAYLRWWDQVAVWRPDKVIAISQQVADRCQQFYNRKVDEVIYPPVIVPSQIKASSSQTRLLPIENYLLCISRLVPYKNIDLALQAALKLDQTMVIIGTGTELENLVQLAGSSAYLRLRSENIEEAIHNGVTQNKRILFVKDCSEVEKALLLAHCKAVLMPGIEDFGITALEANTFGKPVIISAQSGVAEVLKDQKHAIHLQTQDISEIIAAVKKIDTTQFSKEKLKVNSSAFSQEEFVRKFHNLVFAFYTEHSTIKK